MNPKLSCVILGADITAQGTQPVPRYGCLTALGTSQCVCSQHWWRGEPPRQHFCPVSVRGRGKEGTAGLGLQAVAINPLRTATACAWTCAGAAWNPWCCFHLTVWWGAEGLSLNLSKWDALSNVLKLSLINIWDLVQMIRRNKWLKRI